MYFKQVTCKKNPILKKKYKEIKNFLLQNAINTFNSFKTIMYR